MKKLFLTLTLLCSVPLIAVNSDEETDINELIEADNQALEEMMRKHGIEPNDNRSRSLEISGDTLPEIVVNKRIGKLMRMGNSQKRKSKISPRLSKKFTNNQD